MSRRWCLLLLLMCFIPSVTTMVATLLFGRQALEQAASVFCSRFLPACPSISLRASLFASNATGWGAGGALRENSLERATGNRSSNFLFFLSEVKFVALVPWKGVLQGRYFFGPLRWEFVFRFRFCFFCASSNEKRGGGGLP